MITRRQAIKLVPVAGGVFLFGCTQENSRKSSGGDATGTKSLRVLATSDTHGMFMPWDYVLDEESPSGLLAW